MDELETQKWNTSMPPNEVIVQVKHGDEVLEVMAFYGREGHLPHWTTADHSKAWSVDYFTHWRYIPPSSGDKE